MDTLITVFICYDSSDSVIAEECHRKLEQAGFTVNIDKKSIHTGDEWKVRIENLIRNSDVALFILTENIKEKSYVFDELKQILAHGIPLIPYAPNGFKQPNLNEKEKHIHSLFINEEKKISDIQHTDSYDDAYLALQQRALEYKMAPNGKRSKLGISAKELIKHTFTGYLSNSESPFNLLLLYQRPTSISTQHLIQESIELLHNICVKPSFCFIPFEIPKASDVDRTAILKECLSFSDGVIIFDIGEQADYSEVIEWSERRVNVNKPVMRYVPSEIQPSERLKRFEAIEDLTQLSSLLRIASVRSNKSLLYLRCVANALLFTIAAVIISAIIGVCIYNHKEKNLVASELTNSNNMSDLILNTVFGSANDKCDILFFKSIEGNDSIKQFFPGNYTYDKNKSIIGAAMRGAEIANSPFYIVWERQPHQSQNGTDEKNIIFAARKVTAGHNAGKFEEIPQSCIQNVAGETRIIIDKNNSITAKYQSAYKKDNQKLLVACYAQLADADANNLRSGLSFEVGENQFTTAIKDKLTDINYLNKIEAVTKLINWMNIYHETMPAPNGKPFEIKSGLSKDTYNALVYNFSIVLGHNNRISLFYANNDSVYYLSGEPRFSMKDSNIGAAMQAPDWCLCYNEGEYSAWKKSSHDTKKIEFHKQQYAIENNEYLKTGNKRIDLHFANSTAMDSIKTQICISTEKNGKIMGISIYYNRSGFDANNIKMMAESAYGALKIVFDAYSEYIPMSVSSKNTHTSHKNESKSLEL